MIKQIWEEKDEAASSKIKIGQIIKIVKLSDLDSHVESDFIGKEGVYKGDLKVEFDGKTIIQFVDGLTVEITDVSVKYLALAHAETVLGPEQFKNNRDAAEAIALDFTAGYLAAENTHKKSAEKWNKE